MSHASPGRSEEKLRLIMRSDLSCDPISICDLQFGERDVSKHRLAYEKSVTPRVGECVNLDART
jgi:hypothetical protein